MGENDLIEGEEENKVADKHQWGAAELQKVSNVQDERDDLTVSTDALGKLISGAPSAPLKKINIKKEDLHMIMTEMELPEVKRIVETHHKTFVQSVVRQKLLETDGDPTAALRSFLGV